MILRQLSLKYFFILGLLVILFGGCNSSVQTEKSTPSISAEFLKETPSSTQLEVMSPWPGGGGFEAFNALVEVYERDNPGIEVISFAEAGLSYPEMVAQFNERLEKQEPFDSWHVHPGDQVLNHVIIGQVEPLTQLFKDEGLDEVMPPVLIEQILINGEIYSIPLNIHRSNVLWYNPKIFEANNLAPPETVEEFFEVAEALEDNGINPLALGGDLGFEVGHLFESVLLATLGPDDYLRLFRAGTDMWDDPRQTTLLYDLTYFSTVM